jgi:Virulence protein
MHWATHGNTAAELIYKRADSAKEFMGMTNCKGNLPIKSETEIAKNYLIEKEIFILDRLVSSYLDFAEIQALEENPMYMKDWIDQLDGFIKLAKKDILSHRGSVTHEEAMKKAHKEYDKYKNRISSELTDVEKHYLEEINILEKMEN